MLFSLEIWECIMCLGGNVLCWDLTSSDSSEIKSEHYLDMLSTDVMREQSLIIGAYFWSISATFVRPSLL